MNAKTTLLATGAFLLLAAGNASAETITGQINATITLESGCVVNGDNNSDGTTNVDFGTLDFGTETTLFTQADADVVGSGAGITVQCTAGVAPVLTFGAGQHDGSGSGSGNKAMQHASDNAQFVTYSLYSDAGRANVINSGHQVTLDGNGSEQTVPVYGRAFGAANLIAGTYTDTVQVTLEF